MNKSKERDLSGKHFINRDQLITLGDLQAFKEDLLLSIKAMIQTMAAPSTKKWLKSYEVKKILDISNGTLQTLRNNGTIPFTKIGGIIYYDSEDINKVLEERKRQYPPGVISRLKNTNSL